MAVSHVSIQQVAADAGVSLHSLLKRVCHRPLVPVCLGFVLGCCAATSEARGGFLPLLISVIALACGFALLVAGPRTRHAQMALAAALALTGYGLGCARAFIVSGQRAADTLTQSLARVSPAGAGSLATISGTISSPMHSSARGEWTMMDADRFSPGRSVGRSAASVSSRVVVFLPESASGRIDQAIIGNRISVTGLLSPVGPAGGSAAGGGWDDWLRTQGVTARMSVSPVPDAVRVTPAGRPGILSIMPRCADEARVWCERQLQDGALDAPEAATASGILLGERSDLSPEQSSRFAAAGCAHLLATAGLHVGILVMVAQFVFRAATVPRKLSAVLIIGLVWLYALAAGDRAAVARAASVATLYYGAILLERAPDLLSALALCAVAMLWTQPLLIADAGFQLSFITVIGLILVMPPLTAGVADRISKIRSPGLRRVTHGLVELECLALAAQAVSAPLVAAHYNQVSCLGVFANLVACPLMFLLIPASVGCLLVATFSGAAGAICLHAVLNPLLQTLLSVIDWFSALPGCVIAVAAPAWWQIALYYCVIYAGCRLLRPRTSHEAEYANDLAGGIPVARPDSAAAHGQRGDLAAFR